MSRYSIDIKYLETAMRQHVDMAAHHAVSRFERELGEHAGLAHRIARAAAQTAVEQFASYCNAQLRLIQVDHENRVDLANLSIPEFIIKGDKI